jgi:2-dehydro-3-deoxyphosphogluconate aldolase/(4S)-4-hydroxy-2-oxoglutarate aldolase
MEPSMTGESPRGALFDHHVVPLASVTDPEHVDIIGDGLASGGLPVVEVALRGAHGLGAVRRLSERGDLLVGAGTVVSVDQARDALDAGATFIVTPGLDAEVVRFVHAAGVPIVPGVLTPTEVQAAIGLGLTRLKLVYREVRFMPSGGIRQENLAEHLAHPAVFAASGSWITGMASQGVEAVAAAAQAAASVEPGR